MIKLAAPLKVTFHKACDTLIENRDITQLLDLYKKNENFDTILTQGGIKPINDNLLVLKDLKQNFNILIGGGVNKNNYYSLQEISNYLHIGSLGRINKDYNLGFNTKLLEQITK